MKSTNRLAAVGVRQPLGPIDGNTAIVSARAGAKRERRFSASLAAPFWRPAAIPTPRLDLDQRRVMAALGWHRLNARRREALRLIRAASDAAALTWLQERIDPGRSWEPVETAAADVYAQRAGEAA